METLTRFFNPPKQSYFLFGPRGTGKSTWMRFFYKDAFYLDLLAPDVFRSLSAKPERLRELVQGEPLKTTFIIDEVQKVPELLSVVHQMIEEKKARQFILTGSSARKLKRSGADLLGGRAVMRGFHPFMAAELAGRFNFEYALEFGTLPLIYPSSNPKDVLSAYVGLYLREEVQAEGLVRSIGNFSRFLEAISFSQGALLNISNVARECEIERKVVEGYVAILQDLLLAVKLWPFTKRAKREIVSHPKFYYFDAGVYRALRPAGPLDQPEEIAGAALETLIFQHLRAWVECCLHSPPPELYFWRSKNGFEVDFVIYGPNHFYAVEVKNTARIRPADLKGLKEFGQDYPQAKLFMVYRGSDQIQCGQVVCTPCERFLRNFTPVSSSFGMQAV